MDHAHIYCCPDTLCFAFHISVHMTIPLQKCNAKNSFDVCKSRNRVQVSAWCMGTVASLQTSGISHLYIEGSLAKAGCPQTCVPLLTLHSIYSPNLQALTCLANVSQQCRFQSACNCNCNSRAAKSCKSRDVHGDLAKGVTLNS